MALRTLAARMRTPVAAAAPRLSPAPRVAPPAGTVPKFFTSSFQERSTYTMKHVEMLYQKNLKILDGVKNQERTMNTRVWVLKTGSKCMKWFFRLLFPIPLAAAVLKIAH